MKSRMDELTAGNAVDTTDMLEIVRDNLPSEGNHEHRDGNHDADEFTALSFQPSLA